MKRKNAFMRSKKQRPIGAIDHLVSRLFSQSSGGAGFLNTEYPMTVRDSKSTPWVESAGERWIVAVRCQISCHARLRSNRQAANIRCRVAIALVRRRIAEEQKASWIPHGLGYCCKPVGQLNQS